MGTQHTQPPGKKIEVEKDKDNVDGGAVGGATGALGGAALGAAIGTAVPGVGNVIGAVVGGIIGAVGGGAAGAAIGSALDPDVEDKYWKETHVTRAYAKGGQWEDYAPAYRYGYQARSRFPSTTKWNDEIDREMSTHWDKVKGTSRLTWDKARMATKDAWDRIERALPGDFDGDGR